MDDDFNIYTTPEKLQTLQKWLPGAEKPINLLEEIFQSTPIFYHSLSRSLYFFYVFRKNPGVYKLVDGSSMPVNVINASGEGKALNQLGTSFGGLYVTLTGDIFIIDSANYRVVKWAMNATSGVLVAGGNRFDSDSDQFVTRTGLYVDETNNVLYIVEYYNCIRKYTIGSTDGVIILGGGPNEVLSNVMTEYIKPISVLVDKMGNILVAEVDRITKWTPDIKSSVIVIGQQNQDLRATTTLMGFSGVMTFDKLENLYVYDNGGRHVVKFTRNSTSCMKNLY